MIGLPALKHIEDICNDLHVPFRADDLYGSERMSLCPDRKVLCLVFHHETHL
jgi:hypothetical protein